MIGAFRLLRLLMIGRFRSFLLRLDTASSVHVVHGVVDVVVSDCRHPCFRNFTSILPVDVATVTLFI